MIRYENINVTFGDFVAIPQLDLQVDEGEFFTLLGPSGCGKTTALRTLAGFVQPAAGDVHIDGRPVTRLPSDKRRVGMVFQNYALFPSMNVWENIAFGLKVRKESKAEVDRLVRDIARRVDLSDEQLEKDLAALSGGQQQRVAIARALVLQPKILLLDEPLSNLDAKLRGQLRIQLKELQAQFGITTLYVTHDQDEALTMSDRIAVFNHGRVEQVGTPQEIYDQSATEFVCNFIGDSSRLTPDFVAQVNLGAGSDLPLERSSYLRQEKVGLQPNPALPRSAALDGVVVSRRYHGVHSSYTVSSHGSTVKVMQREDGTVQPRVGDAVTLHVNPANVLQYTPDGVAAATPDVAAAEVTLR
ncbi:ABC transporter ATP-binding protein [Occultella gossypii]|uniref:ABC transporter ATP-binding protein n=1 Tax=Occultella gossypii TaxID=2800820 RepID=A0ABS7S342_9MICO|nr:ABC transporter ATP-binding protein [Occultella gossypii]MBZ2194762.1 ABC transporter ATP-binding protein [Occultella gossypii]